jgi:hypothetical protein
MATKEPAAAKFLFSRLPPKHRDGWNKACDMFQLEFFSTVSYPTQVTVYQMAKSAAQNYSLKDESEPDGQQIAAVRSSC